jgi:hypothetical protein
MVHLVRVLRVSRADPSLERDETLQLLADQLRLLRRRTRAERSMEGLKGVPRALQPEARRNRCERETLSPKGEDVPVTVTSRSR